MAQLGCSVLVLLAVILLFIGLEAAMTGCNLSQPINQMFWLAGLLAIGWGALRAIAFIMERF